MNVSPGTLKFYAPFTHSSTETLTITNNTDSPYAFKVRTTAPKTYCVRPNSAYVKPGESVDVSIILQGFKEELPSDYVCKDKFLLVSIPVTEEQTTQPLSEVWPKLEESSKSSIVNKKVKVVYVFSTKEPAEKTSTDGSALLASADSDLKAASAAAAAAGTGFSSPLQSKESNGDFHSPSQPSASSELSSDPTVESELKKSQERISKLSQQMESHKEGSAASKARVVTPAAPTKIEGVPVTTAALLALVAFLIGWLFF